MSRTLRLTRRRNLPGPPSFVRRGESFDPATRALRITSKITTAASRGLEPPIGLEPSRWTHVWSVLMRPLCFVARRMAGQSALPGPRSRCRWSPVRGTDPVSGCSTQLFSCNGRYHIQQLALVNPLGQGVGDGPACAVQRLAGRAVSFAQVYHRVIRVCIRLPSLGEADLPSSGPP